MTLAYIAKLGFTIQKTSIKTNKIGDSILETYDIVSAHLLLQNSLERVQFFE